MERGIRREVCTFKKELTKSDVARQQNRLRLVKDKIKDELLPHLAGWEKEKIEKGGLLVKVTDDNSGKEYDMRLTAWNNNNCYVLNGDGWARFLSDNGLGEEEMENLNHVIEVSASYETKQ